MSTSNSYKNLKELTEAIQTTLTKLENGKLHHSEIEYLLTNTRELHERVAILQYVLNTQNNAKEPQQLNSEATHIAPSKAYEIEEKQTAQLVNNETETPSKEKKGFRLNFNLFSAEPETESSNHNQINLLDVIKEEAPIETPIPESVTSYNSTAEVPDTSMNKVIARVSEKQSLNEKLAEINEKPTLATKLSRKPIKDLNEEIGLNQKFLFMNDLFGGENTLYKEAINTLNAFENREDAIKLLEKLTQRHNWDSENISVQKFTDLVERKYS